MWAAIASDKLFVSYTLHDGSLEHLNTCIAFGRSYKSPEGTIWLMAYISGSAWAIHFHSDDAAASQFHWVILKSLAKSLLSKVMFIQQMTFWEDINLEIWMEMLVCWYRNPFPNADFDSFSLIGLILLDQRQILMQKSFDGLSGFFFLLAMWSVLLVSIYLFFHFL